MKHFYECLWCTEVSELEYNHNDICPCCKREGHLTKKEHLDSYRLQKNETKPKWTKTNTL